MQDFLFSTEEVFSKSQFIKLLEDLNLNSCLLKSKTILIKPNFAAGSYVSKESHVISDLNLLKQICDLILEINKDCVIYVAESDSTGYGFAFLKFFNLDLFKWETNRLKLLDLSRDILVKTENKDLKYFNIRRQLWLSKILVEADFIISLANIKTNSVTKFTGACKNMFGILPNMNKEIFHPNISAVLFDLISTVQVNLSILDGYKGMHKNGPVQGEPINFGFRIFANNPIIADLVACKALNIEGTKIEHLKLLSKKLTPFEIRVPDYKMNMSMPGIVLTINNYIGLKVQKIGQSVSSLGHRIHTASNVLDLFINIFRPILIGVFGVERLKMFRKNIFNK